MFFVVPFSSFAQRNGKNLPYYEHKKFHAGTHLGITYSTYNYKLYKNLHTDDSLYQISIRSQPGFAIHVPMAAWSPVYYVHFRFVASISFHETLFDYTYWKKGELTHRTYRTDPTRLNFPLQIKLNSKRLTNFGAYALGGFCYSYDLSSQHKVIQTPSNPIVKTKPADFSYSVGGGFDFFLEYFKFGIELKVQNGLRDILIHDNSFFSTPIQSLKSHTLWIQFTFET